MTNSANPAPRRFGQVIGLPRENQAEYLRLHSEVWPGVLRTISACGIRNYSIFLHDELLFASFDYVGDDFETDMARMSADEETQRWWSVCKPLQRRLDTAADGEWWADAAEVFHLH